MMQQLGRLKKIWIFLSILLASAIAVLIFYGVQGNRENYSQISYQCAAEPGNLGEIQNPQAISLSDRPLTLSGLVTAGQDIGYSFEARSGQKLSYTTRSDNLCIWLHGPDGKTVKDPELSENGQYIIQVATLSGSRTFEIDFKLDPGRSEARPSQASPASLAQASSTPEGAFLGHLPYKESPQNSLITIASYAQEPYQRFEQLDEKAGKALMKVIYAARDDGVWIVPISAFRNIQRQRILFEHKVEERGSMEAAAKVSAPPGYSEHHTGYAVDLGDGRFPKQDVTDAFAKTDAYRWLVRHAGEFGFELSFPPQNLQGVSFEPWHWRFVGSPEAKAVFAKAKSIK